MPSPCFGQGQESTVTIEYRDNQPLDPVEVARVFEASGIARPTKDIPRIAQMSQMLSFQPRTEPA